jgi:HPt (histidine-containing phosphotransfer) domain-containing protein
LFLELVESFRRDAAKGLSEIRRSASNGDSHALALAAHTLRGVVSIFAAAPAIRATQALEQAGRTGVTDVAALLTELEEVLGRLSDALSQYGEAATRR